jgi:hypothetical protein
MPLIAQARNTFRDIPEAANIPQRTIYVRGFQIGTVLSKHGGSPQQ